MVSKCYGRLLGLLCAFGALSAGCAGDAGSVESTEGSSRATSEELASAQSAAQKQTPSKIDRAITESQAAAEQPIRSVPDAQRMLISADTDVTTLNTVSAQMQSQFAALGTAAQTVSAAAIGLRNASGSVAIAAAIAQLEQTQQSFNLQYLQLQIQMQNENRQYTTLSNILKTKHDTVKNSISNVH